MSRFTKCLYFLTLHLLLLSCTPEATPSLKAPMTRGITSPVPRVTIALPTQTAAQLSTPNENKSDADCFEMVGGVPETNPGLGVVALDNTKVENGRIQPGFFFLNMETMEISDLEKPGEGLEHAFISPDGTRMAAELIKFEKSGEAYKTLSDELVIMDANGIIQNRFPMEDGVVGGPSWLDNQRLVLNKAGLDPEENRAEKPSTLQVLNPFTYERKILKSDFPEIYAGYPLPYWDEPWGYSLAVYNPSLSHVVYLGEGGTTYVLWNLQQKREVARFRHWNASKDEQPRWSPDGLKFVMNAYRGDMSLWPQPADGVYIIDLEGNVTEVMDTSNHVYIWDHFWSPSGRYLALFQIIPDAEIQKKRLLVVDTESLKILDTCVEYQSWMQNDVPVWSLDDTQILLYENTQNKSHVILVDLSKKIAFPIAEDLEPKGWMKTP